MGADPVGPPRGPEDRAGAGVGRPGGYSERLVNVGSPTLARIGRIDELHVEKAQCLAAEVFAKPVTLPIRKSLRYVPVSIWPRIETIADVLTYHVMNIITFNRPRNRPKHKQRSGFRSSTEQSSDITDAGYRQGARGTDTEHLRAGSLQRAKDHDRKSGVSLLARSKRGTRFRTAPLLGGTNESINWSHSRVQTHRADGAGRSQTCQNGPS
jgi:hypothetical protein